MAPLPAALAEWQRAVDELSHTARHTDPPRVQWCTSSTSTRYTRRTDTIGVDRRFARRWAPTSPEARWLLAHELGHRFHPDVAASAERAALRSSPVLGVALLGWLVAVVAAVVPLLSVKPGAMHFLMSVSMSICFAFAAGVVTVWVGRHVITRRARAALFAAEFAADDYATALVGVDGCEVLPQLPNGGRLRRVSPRTHPPDDDRVARQRP